MNKILFINLWDKGGMRHYSDALVNKLINNNEVIYITNYASEIQVVNKLTRFSLNIFNVYNYIDMILLSIYIIRSKANTVHLNSGYPFLIFIYPIFYFFNSVATIHDAVPHEGESFLKKIFHKIQMIYFSLFFRKIIVHSEKIKKQLPFFIKKNKVFITPIPEFSHLSYNNIKEKVKHSNKFTILFFGRILEYKGLKYLVDAFNYLEDDKYELIIAGEGKINFEINKNNIQIINRFIKDEEIPFLFNKTNIVVLPYLSASQSGVIYLSFAYNKPVISTKVGSIDDIVIEKYNGLFVNPKSSIELAEKIKFLSTDNLYNEMLINLKKENKIKKNNISTLIKIYEE